MKNDVLNANDFQSNRVGQPRTPVKEWQPGFRVGGPIQRDKLFISVAYDDLLSHSRVRSEPICFPRLRAHPKHRAEQSGSPDSHGSSPRPSYQMERL